MSTGGLMQHLMSTDFELEVVASTPRALHTALMRNRHISELTERLDKGEVSYVELQHFVDELLEAGRPHKDFPYQVALAAIAVAVQDRFRPDFSDRFVRGLAAVRGSRFAMASGVARICIERQRRAINRYKQHVDTAPIRPIALTIIPRPATRSVHSYKQAKWDEIQTTT